MNCLRTAAPFAVVLAILALLGACTTEPAPAPPPEVDTEDPPEAPPPDEPSDSNDDPVDEPEGEDPIGDDPTTDRDTQDAEGSRLAVVDIRVGEHQGFDRVVFELSGPGAGWSIEYGDATAQGSGMPVEVSGNAVLRVAIHGVGYPDDLPEGVEPWLEPNVQGPGTSVIEVVPDTIFEGIHTFFIGTDDELPFFVGELDDPDRLVIDVVHAMG